MDKDTVLQTSFQQNDELYGKTITPVAPPQPAIGIDLNNDLVDNIMEATYVDKVDINKIQSFTSVTRSRNELYDTLDYMALDTTLASVLETYAEDATEMNESGDIIWCVSEDPNVSAYVTFLLNSLNVNKHMFKWTHSLCKYGDVYLRLYRESEIEDRFFRKTEKPRSQKNTLNEDVKIVAYSKNDKYIHYLEQAPNPAQLFELTRFGKSAGYVKTNVESTSTQNNNMMNNTNAYINKYRFNADASDVELFPATEWVHGCLEDDSSRTPEEVELFTDVKTPDGETTSINYYVKRGQSLLYDSYKTWRELMLLENSVLLNRVTQSSIVRVIGVEVGDMPKENVQPHLMNIKQLIEQKAAFDVGNKMSEYTNPGPIVNNIYIPTRNNQGVISTQQIGGDVNVGDLVDLAYYEDKLFGGLRVPKQYFGRTDDAAGFSGGQSLSIISSRYAKMIKRIQSVMIQMITDAINLILIDTDNSEYINKFTLKMLAPTTQEEVDRRDNEASKVGLVGDIMNALADVQDSAKRLQIVKSLLSDVITNTDVIQLIQDEIDALAPPEEPKESTESVEDADLGDLFGSTDDTELFDTSSEPSMDFSADEFPTPPTEEPVENNLPSPEELGIGDLSDATNPALD